MAGTGALEDLLDLRSVTETDRRAGGIDGELSRQIAGDLFLVPEQEALEFADIAERAAIGQLAAGIDGLRGVKGEFLPVLAQALVRHAVALRPVALAPAAHDIEVFQREPGRIDFRVAGGAA